MSKPGPKKEADAVTPELAKLLKQAGGPMVAATLDSLSAYARAARARELESLTTAALNLFQLARECGNVGPELVDDVKRLMNESQRASRAATQVLASIAG